MQTVEERRAYDRAWYARHREHRIRYWRARRARQARPPLPRHRLESFRDLAAYLRRRGHLHMHWGLRAGTYGWALIYQQRTPLCETERCVMIPLRAL